MKERPILFSAPMVRAILDGRKTQTRRVVKHIPMLGDPLSWCAAAKTEEPGWVHIVGDYRRFCPFSQPGDRLWVRETFSLPGLDTEGREIVCYRASGDPVTNGEPWKPSIFMPRWASRLTLEIVSVRVERLQLITEDDAKAEGVDARVCGVDCGEPIANYRTGFVYVWQAINGKTHPWASNPWVWVIEFERITK